MKKLGLLLATVFLSSVALVSCGEGDGAKSEAVLLTGIDASYAKGKILEYENMDLNQLKNAMTVEAKYSDGTAKTLTWDEYSLSGTLLGGETNMITVSYEGQEDTVRIWAGELFLSVDPANFETGRYWAYNSNNISGTLSSYTGEVHGIKSTFLKYETNPSWRECFTPTTNAVDVNEIKAMYDSGYTTVSTFIYTDITGAHFGITNYGEGTNWKVIRETNIQGVDWYKYTWELNWLIEMFENGKMSCENVPLIGMFNHRSLPGNVYFMDFVYGDKIF